MSMGKAASNGLRCRLSPHLPILEWAAVYDRTAFANDLVAAVIVTIMLIPQSLAYALLAGLPPEMGLYASILPLVAYAIFGSSRTLAVGPVAVISLMTAAAAGKIAAQGSPEYLAAAASLAFLSGALLLAMGFLRLGFVASLLSHPVTSGFIAAAGIVIAAGQVRHILGISAGGDTLAEIMASLAAGLPSTNAVTLIIGAGSIAFLVWTRRHMRVFLANIAVPPAAADFIAKGAPLIAVAATTLLAFALELESYGVRLVGHVPQGLPPLSLPSFSPELWQALVGSAALIALIGFAESVSVAQTLAAKRRQRVDPNQELIGLGSANIAAAFSGGYPVTGGFARSVVNFDAGAQTPAAGAFTAAGIALASLFLTPFLHYLPQATLAATIIVAVLSLVDLSILKKTWIYSKWDFAAVATTIVATLLAGVETGIAAGIGLSVLIYLYRTTRPHMAVVGQVPGTEHYRNVLRHDVLTDPRVLSLRVDESLYFANARYLEDRIYDLVRERPAVRHVILMCSAVNEIDMSALESLELINERLSEMGVTFHLSEVKGPVTDRLKRSHFLDHLTGAIHLSHHQAVCAAGADEVAPALPLAR
jgi:SulP family sulfate permease